MAQFFNQYEVERIAEHATYYPHLAPFGAIALAYVERINANSDGWAYWKAGHRAAAKFLDKLNRATSVLSDYRFDEAATVTEADLRKAMAPMKSLLTKHKLPALPPV